MEHVSSIICNKIIEDKHTNIISLIEVVDAVEIPQELASYFENPGASPAWGGIPGEAAPPLINVFSLWYRTDLDKPERGLYNLKLVIPDGKSLPLVEELAIDLTDEISYRSVIKMAGFPFRGLGKYIFLVSKKNEGQKSWVKCARLPMLLRISRSPTSSLAAPSSSALLPPSLRLPSASLLKDSLP